MRTTTRDRSLTGVAGPPLLTVRQPTATTLKLVIDHPYTVITVGAYRYRPDAPANGQFMFGLSVPNRYAYVRYDPPAWGPVVVGGVEGGYLRVGELWAAWTSMLSGYTGNIGIFRHRNGGTSYDWAGACAGVLYDRILSRPEAEAVARHLASTIPPPP